MHSIMNAKYSSPTSFNGNSPSNGTTHKNGDSTDAINNSINSNGSNGSNIKSPIRTEKPVQKVIPSRNSTPIKTYQQTSNITNGNQTNIGDAKTKEYSVYMKPISPTKSVTTPTGKTGPKIAR